MYFIYLVKPARPGFEEAMLPAEQEIVLKHVHYLQDLHNEGKIVHVGRCTDKSYGLVIFRAADETEALNIMKNDPVVKECIMTADLHEYIPAFHSEAL